LAGNSSFAMNLATDEEDEMLIIKNDHFKKAFSDPSMTKNFSL